MRQLLHVAIALAAWVAQPLHAQINTSKPVGVLDGAPGVSPDGASTYTIPLKIPSGVAGMQPTLALLYNSRTTDGLAGWGWNISGLSVIARGNQTRFYNYQVNPLKLNASDNYFLDGQLLMPVTGTNGANGTVYRTEVENYAKIESFGGTNGNPDWWRVTNKDGSIIEYGVSAAERLVAGGANSIWYVSRAADINNNAITYTYGKLANEIWLNTISYSNAGISFEYVTRENANVSFIGGSSFPNTKLLSNIVVKLDNVRQISYRLTHEAKIKRHYLKTVELIGTDNASSLLTNFNYGNPDNEESMSVYRSTYQNPFPNVTLSPGDYDGDGRTDLVVAERKGNVNGDGTGLKSTTSGAYSIITNVGIRPNGSVEPSKFELLHRYAPATYMKADEFTSPYSYYSTDFYGNGKDGVLRPKKIWNAAREINYADSLFIETFDRSGTSLALTSRYIPTPTSAGIIYNYYLKKSNSFIQGDFDGDGKVDVIYILGYQYQPTIFTYDYNYKGFFTNLSTGDVNREILGIDNAFKTAEAIYPVDFDGDGKQELMMFKPSGYNIYSIEPISATSGYTHRAVLLYSGTEINYTSYKRVLTGDFNGDKKTDIIGITTSQAARLFYSMGTRFVASSFQLDRKPDFTSSFFDFFTAADYNGDGITDLFHYYHYPLTSGGTTNWYPKQSIHYFKGMTYAPATTTTGYDIVCANQDIPYDDYRILSVNPAACFDANTMSWVDQWRIEYTNSTPETATANFTKGAAYYSDMMGNMLYGSQPENGDFNGDGKPEIIQSLGAGDYVLLDPTGSDKNSSLLQSVTDAFGVTTSFSYRTLAEKSSETVYTGSGISSPGYPLNLMPLPMRVVTRVTQPDGIGGTAGKVYQYQDALNDRQKGFLGFLKTVTIKNNNIVERSENRMDTYYRVVIPLKKQTFYKEDASTAEELVSTSITATNIIGLSVSSPRFYFFNRYKLQPANTVTIDELSKSATKKEYTYDSYDNLLQEVTKEGYWQADTLVTVETGTSITEYTQTGKALVPMFPIKNTITNLKGSKTAKRVTTYTYTADRGLRATQTSWAETALASTTTYSYSSYGNLVQSVVAVPGKPEVTATSTYDARQRFVVANTVTADNVTRSSSITSHPLWGVILSKTDGDGTEGSLTTTYEYDALGRLKKTTTPLGNVITESYVWDVSGQQTYYLLRDYADGVGADEKIWYDKLGRVIKTQALGWNNKWLTQTKTYDNKGREKTSSSPHYDNEPILINTNNYDKLYRLVSVVTPAGTNALTYSYPGTGRSVIAETNAAGQTSQRTMDPMGQTIETKDHGGTVLHVYDERGNIASTRVNNVIMQTHTYDAYGRKTRTVDNNAGTVSYVYDASDNITRITEATGKIITNVYDGLNRLLSRTTPEDVTTYEYYNTPNNKALKKISNANHTRELTYDNYQRIIKKLETVTGSGNFTTQYIYDSLGKLGETVYPNNIRIQNVYNNAGILSKVTSGTHTLFEAIDYDGQGHATRYKLVNGKESVDTYDQGLPVRFYTQNIQDLNFTFNNSTGNLMSRRDAIRSVTEVFTYDNLNRLTSATVNNVNQFSITYAGNTTQSNGNIAAKTNFGSYTYLTRKPHAVAYISPLTDSSLVLDPAMNITYSSFQRPLKITKDSSTIDLIYGVDDERVKTVSVIGSKTETKVFLGSYEKQTLPGGGVNGVIYVAGGNGLCAMMINSTPVAVYTDYQGSILTVTNVNGTVVARQNFDAWGRRRNPNNWAYANAEAGNTALWLYRGYTGHEHLPAFRLINMNARLYDPYSGRMLSPDNITNGSIGTQGYNKFSYAYNNPMKYVDPDGNDPISVALIIAAVVGAYTGGTLANEGEMNPFKWDFSQGRTWGYMIGGAAMGALSGALGAGVSASGGFMANTMGIVASSMTYSMGMYMITDGKMAPSVSFGVISYDFGTTSWNYLGKKGNKWYTNLSYVFGALANLQDLVTGFSGKDYQYQYEFEKTEDQANIGHGNLREVLKDPVTGETLLDAAGVAQTEVKISVANSTRIPSGPNGQFNGSGIRGAIRWAWRANFKKWYKEAKFYDPPEVGWPRIPLNLNSKIIDWMHRNINPGVGKTATDLWGFGKLRFGVNFGCVSYAARALWTAGVPTIPVINWLGPRVLWIQLAARHAGIVASPIGYNLPQ